MEGEEEKYLEFVVGYPGWEVEKALCKLLNRPLKRARRMGIELEELWTRIQEIHDASRGTEIEGGDGGFDGGGIEIDRGGSILYQYSYSCRDQLIFFEFCEGAPLKALKPLLKFARRHKYRIFDAKEIGLMVEGKRKEVFDYASGKLVPAY